MIRCNDALLSFLPPFGFSEQGLAGKRLVPLGFWAVPKTVPFLTATETAPLLPAQFTFSRSEFFELDITNLHGGDADSLEL